MISSVIPSLESSTIFRYQNFSGALTEPISIFNGESMKKSVEIHFLFCQFRVEINFFFTSAKVRGIKEIRLAAVARVHYSSNE